MSKEKRWVSERNAESCMLKAKDRRLTAQAHTDLTQWGKDYPKHHINVIKRLAGYFRGSTLGRLTRKGGLTYQDYAFDEVHAMIVQMPPVYKEIIYLHYVEFGSVTEKAKRAGISRSKYNDDLKQAQILYALNKSLQRGH